jgi:ubiquinone/menaquinone biosynthesis C-methylase UbiE/ribosomal protein S27AE
LGEVIGEELKARGKPKLGSMPTEKKQDHPPVCDYEGSDYQKVFWEEGDRVYEDQVEDIAIRRLLPQSGKLLLEVGAGAGRNTKRYKDFEQIVLLDYSSTQLAQAQKLLGTSDRYIYVSADAYRLPFVDGLFDAATMIRTLHHMADAPKALSQIYQILGPKAFFLLEYANKLNMKAILRYLLGKQEWSPFTREAVEFMELNFDFHPKSIRGWLEEIGFRIGRTITVSHFRVGWLKRNVPLNLLVWLDSIFQYTGALWQLTPSVFLSAESAQSKDKAMQGAFFKCPECGTILPEHKKGRIQCPGCGLIWGTQKGIYNFKEPLKK